MSRASFFGLDPAWSDRHGSGVCALDAAGKVLAERRAATDDEIVDWIDRLADGRAVVAADIPLTVPNQTGARPCDRAVASAYGARRAGPHPANRSLFTARHGRIRGEDLAARLADLGFGDPWSGGDRIVLEVYPHPGLVEVFGLPERLLYKKGRLADRAAGLRRLRALLDRLADADPPLSGPAVPIPRTATGRELKAIEDRLDARFCAWAAAVWGTDPGRMRLFGDRAGGHIAVPVSLR